MNVPTPAMTPDLLDGLELALSARGVVVDYAGRRALDGVDLDVPRQRVTALVGPSGCGKSSLLRCFNRLNDEIADCRVAGEVRLFGEDAYADGVALPDLRRRVGMVFQKPNPFPLSVSDNVAFGLRLAGLRSRREIEQRVEAALRAAALWDEVRDRLGDSALALSAGQQQRLVIARAIAVEPDVLLMDEPASMLDPISTLRFEELVVALAERYTVLVVTHNMQQAARVADYTAFMRGGRVLEVDRTEAIFTNPRLRETEDYITGRSRTG
ncbi:phosphate ABC transporter ATP-binding protein PstB [Tahibacter soli]|uniref:Phosphate ABC transporter ATP-binding protein PstB n=1 Tax=Tahibacter soli TaxID=2983605 RepID=A0A9X3YJD4_9GAMM|nr:phosphate ABC transporter ATP-binding protein PstB [Tahibacter soli]MDC8012181.1 phosphate ABC transporter ATP-binding protein PstB [Tahibacter soli]